MTPRHWVTSGLTELYPKESEILERSGWGYELTMRAPADADWPRELLRGLANWADASRTLLHAGEVGSNGGPLFSDRPCELTGWALIEDPALPPIDTPHGRVEFLQVVTLRPEEVERWRELRPELERRSPVELNTLTRPPSGPRAGSAGSGPGR